MLDLLKAFSISEILIFIVLFALAVKGIIDFFDWAYGKLDNIFHKKYEDTNKDKEMEEELKKLNETIVSLVENYSNVGDRLSEINQNVININHKVEQLQNYNKEQDKQLNQMLSSDMHAIKSYIVDEYYKHKDSKEIEDMVMECIERRYEDYVKEKGNSYVEGLMKELRTFTRV